MNQTEVFTNLKSAVEDAVIYILEYGLPEEYETRRSELMEVILNEVSRRKDGVLYNRNVTANMLTGRKKYER